VRGSIRLSIHQPLAFETLQRFISAGSVFKTKIATVRIAEVEFGKIAIKMLLANVVICSIYAALENGKIIFSAIDVNEPAQASIFICGVVNGSVARKFFAKFRVSGVFVGRQVRFAAGSFNGSFAQCLCGCVLNIVK
jgi:hypothetical protein